MFGKKNDEEKKCCFAGEELSLDELDRVRGGYEKNTGGTFSLSADEEIKGCGFMFVIKENYPEATLDSWIHVEERTEDGTSYGDNSYLLRAIFEKTGQLALNMGM